MRAEQEQRSLLPTPEAAREYLENHPRVWPYASAALFGFIGLGPAARLYGLDVESFGRVCTAANEKMGAVKERVQAGGRVEGPWRLEVETPLLV